MHDSAAQLGSTSPSPSHAATETSELPSILQAKQAARRLHREAREGRPEALARLRKTPSLRPLDGPELLAALKRRHCLSAIALRLGFQGWSHLTAVLSGREQEDFGTLLYPRSASYWNIWCAHYDEACRIRQEHGGFLLPYQRQFLVADRYLIEALGLDPDDTDWQRIERDWVRPADPEARRRLYDRAIRFRLSQD